MPATILLKRKLTGTAAAPPAAANPGEPLFSAPGFTGGGPNSLYMDTGTAVIPLVDSNRQVELAGPQTITGVKTIAGAGGIGFTAVGNIAFGDGTVGQHLVKGPGTTMVWAAAAAVGVTTDTSLDGDGTPGDPLLVVQATQAQLGGGMISTAALVAAGTDDATLVSPLALRSEMGAAASSLPTTAKQVVPAITEMYNAIAALTGVVIYAGSYDATTSLAVFNGQGGIPASPSAPLPAAAAANHGAYVIVTVAGPGGVAPEPAGPIAVGDWLISDGTAWTKLAFTQAAITAANVSVTPGVPTAAETNVQASLTALHALAIAPILTVTTVLSGDGVTTPLDVILVDGGTYV